MPACGACCYLGAPSAGGRDVAALLTAPADVAAYLAMVAPDGWCVHLDRASRGCTVYDARPRFCRATPAVFANLYGLEEEADFDAAAIAALS
ncbi:hypothetical protein I4F81_002183 [Pyropia yezoensis]|uniref:Uncharacterized protein n=1 Tax=Pyropia yezoensis TaxID=2788 RepID=A0ACC3BPP1_PYRYE|nr:hypothetical protein I4F81_002183 [Neopyropia yezoensis]